MAGRKVNSLYMLTGQIVSKAGLFISLMIYSRILDDSSFGELLFAISLGLIILFLSDMGATMLVTRRIAAGTSINTILSSAIALRLILSTLAIISVVAFGLISGYSDRQLTLILLVGAGFVLDGFCETSFAVFRAKEVMLNEAIARGIHGLLGILLAVFAWKMNKGVYFAGSSYILREIPALLFVVFILIKKEYFHAIGFTKNMHSVLPLLKSAIPLGLFGILFVAGERMDSIFIKGYLGDEAIAAYQQCIKILDVLVLIVTPTLLPGALFAALCKATKTGWWAARTRIAWMTELFLVIALAVIIPLWAFEQNLLRIVWGSEFLRGISQQELSFTFFIVLITLPVAYMFHMYMAIMISVERQQKAVPIVAVALVVEIILFLILIPAFGIAGAAIAHLGLLFVVAVLLSWDLYRKYGPTGFIRGAIRPVIAAIPAYTILFSRPFNNIGNATISLVAFLVIWFASGGKKIIPGKSKEEVS